MKKYLMLAIAIGALYGLLQPVDVNPNDPNSYWSGKSHQIVRGAGSGLTVGALWGVAATAIGARRKKEGI